MTEAERKDKCEVILREIVRLINTNEEYRFIFQKDWGGDTATIS